jgi:hypothetical protein
LRVNQNCANTPLLKKINERHCACPGKVGKRPSVMERAKRRICMRHGFKYAKLMEKNLQMLHRPSTKINAPNQRVIRCVKFLNQLCFVLPAFFTSATVLLSISLVFVRLLLSTAESARSLTAWSRFFCRFTNSFPGPLSCCLLVVFGIVVIFIIYKKNERGCLKENSMRQPLFDIIFSEHACVAHLRSRLYYLSEQVPDQLLKPHLFRQFLE